MLIYFIMLTTPIHILEKIPFVKVHTNILEFVSTDGIFELHSGVTAMIDSEYVVTDSIKQEEIEEWLQNQHKNVYIYIKQGDTINYSYSLGVVDKNALSEQSNLIMEIYTKWRDKKGLPSSEVKIIVGTDNIGLFLDRV